jgi:predicted Ser/Thr protein kinase
VTQDSLAAGLCLSGGRYEVVSAIARGSMGAVYHAIDRVECEAVALKQLCDPRLAARFEIEARLLAALDHPRVVHVRDHFADGDARFLVMDLVEGADLGAALDQRGQLPLQEVVEIVTQAAEALRYVHQQQIVHRDVKPRNLIAGHDGIVLVDFGIARAVKSRQDTGTIAIGTPRFMAPEVLQAGTVSSRSDVYSLAATAWALLSGEPPIYGEPLRLPGVPPEVEDVLRTGLELAPERRIASVEALATTIGGHLGVHAGASLARSVADAAPQRRSLIEVVVRTAVGIFEAASASVALVEPGGEQRYLAAWGASADRVVGVRLQPGEGLAGTVASSGQPLIVPDCRGDPRFAEHIAQSIGYMPRTILIVPLLAGPRVVGTLSILDRRDGSGFGVQDVPRAQLFAELAVATLEEEGTITPQR